MAIIKSEGQTPTERFLANLCDKTFLRLWAYPNPYKAEGKELCDLLVVFEERVFLFFDRASNKFDDKDKDVILQWKRWKAEAIDKQITTAIGARNHILKNPQQVFLDAKCTIPLPVPINATADTIHKIVVAHGAEEACKAFSDDNVFGSLAISYGMPSIADFPFQISLDRDDIIHVFDSFNLPIILQERDTVFDFSRYITEKEAAIRKYSSLVYHGEEDLLAHYFFNFDAKLNKNNIGAKDQNEHFDFVMISEGEWKEFSQSQAYKRKKEADKVSYVWDAIIQKTSQNALDGVLLGERNLFSAPSAIREMAKEPRFSRRALAEEMTRTINNFPDIPGGLSRNVSLFPSFYEDKAYVFLQIRADNEIRHSPDFREKRMAMLRIACGAAKNARPELNWVIGICIDAPKFHRSVAEDFILLKCDNWTDEERGEYEKENEGFRFFKTENLRLYRKSVAEFPPAPPPRKNPRKTGRNELCPCGSRLKYKKCCWR